MDKSDFSFLANAFVTRGVSVALINYDFLPEVTMSMVAQVRKACTWIVENAESVGVSCGGIHLIGWSAGAHLSTMLLCSDDALSNIGLPIRSLLAISGVYDLRPVLQTSANAELHLDEEEARRNSPINFPPPQEELPIALVWGGEETSAFREQSLLLLQMWRAKGAEISGLEVPKVHHYAVLDFLADERSAVFSDGMSFAQPETLSPTVVAE